MPAGRPLLYKPNYHPEQARKYCLLGATDERLSELFEVSLRSIESWKAKYPEFLHAVRAGRDAADAEVAERLYNRAMGYSLDAVKIFADAKTGAQKIVNYIENYPPDTTAAIFWLKNRQRARWRDTYENRVSIDPASATDEQLAAIAFGGGKNAAVPEESED